MKRLTYLLLLALLLSLFGCKNAATQQEINNLNNSTNVGSSQQSSNGSSTHDTPNQQSNQAVSPELSKKIEEYYKNWDQGQIKLTDNNFVNYYSLTREKTDGKKANSLLIYLDGTGYQSVMGVKSGNDWLQPGNPYGFAKNRFSDFDFLAIDKVNVKMGGDHNSDPAVINNYSFDSRVKSSVSAIDNFLKDKNYKEIFLLGISEGGQILPRVYTQLQHKDKITKLVVLFSGGLSQYEQFKILGKSNLPMQPGYKEMYSQVEDAYKDIIKNPESTEKQYGGHSYKRMYGFLMYNPMDDYININIPILMVHGAEDTNSPVESARAVEAEFKKLGKNNLKYIEYSDMAHGPENIEQGNQVFESVNNWLKGV